MNIKTRRFDKQATRINTLNNFFKKGLTAISPYRKKEKTGPKKEDYKPFNIH